MVSLKNFDTFCFLALPNQNLSIFIEHANQVQCTPMDYKHFQANHFCSEYFHFELLFQIIIDGRDTNVTDKDGFVLPTLVYLAREKRPQHHHNFKAGAMNALVMCILADKMTRIF